MLLAANKRPREAAVLLRAILDEKPGASRVRLELAAILATLGDDAAARRELRAAQAGGLPPQVAQAVNQFATALRSRKPVGASIEMALVPDSNINRATDAQMLDTIIAPLELSRDARSQSGVGARIAGQAFFRHPVSPALSVVPRVSAQGEFYRQSQFNDASASALIGLEWSPGRERIQVSGGATQRWYGGASYARTATVTLNWQHPLNPRTQITANATVANTDYRQNDLQDGMLYNVELGVERAFSARAGGGVSLSTVRQRASDPGYSTLSGGATILIWREFGRTTGFATLTGRRLEADERLFLYPERRKDTLLGGTMGATFRSLTVHGFAPLLRVTYERNFSTVGIYDYRRIATTAGITRAF
ncbi:surface lipoprotein assembly modifier [Sphingomonas sp. HF-S3]|uniref:Surface lipoprotein assembly modifier n=1 Tax=Sphingomonas rustica TaxID=3103142 RepID=A0ABV0BDA5_9SPHN